MRISQARSRNIDRQIATLFSVVEKLLAFRTEMKKPVRYINEG